MCVVRFGAGPENDPSGLRAVAVGLRVWQCRIPLAGNLLECRTTAHKTSGGW